MRKKPLISVITATYNSAAYLEKSILSIINQNFKEVEYIIIDGNSKDDTVEIIKRYEDHIAYWVTEPDGGIYDAWNKGLARANGQWITFLGSDDTFYPGAFQRYSDFIAKEPEKTDLISSKMHTVDGDDQITRTVGWPWSWEELIRINPIAHPGALHNRRLFEKYGNFDTSYKICGDHEFLLRTGPGLKAAFMNEVTVRMFDGGASSSVKMYKETLKAVKETGKVQPGLAYGYYYFQVAKFYIKKLLKAAGIRKVGIRREFTSQLQS
jgi:glycosyltransferase involved in cell wall biosynthesis